MAKKPGLAVAIAIGKPKKRPDDLGSPSDLGAPPRKTPQADMDTDTGDDTDAEGADTSSGNISISLSREQASVLSDVLSQIQGQLGQDGSFDPEEEEEEDYPLAGGRNSYGA